MKLPNGYGSVSKMSGKRRRPFMIRKNGKVVGYTKTREEGLELLAEINKDGFNPENNLSFTEVYELLVKSRFPHISKSTQSQFKGKYKLCKDLYKLPYATLRQKHFLSVLDKAPTLESRRKTLQFLRAMDKVAFDYDVITKQYTQTIENIKNPNVTKRKPFNEEEIQVLWKNKDLENVDLVLILIYTGMRSGELAALKIEDVDFEKGIMRGGNKTKAGRNRIIPIHPKIEILIKNRIELSKRSTVLNFGDKQLRLYFKRVMNSLNMKHIPHECRHTFRTRLDNLDVNKNVIDMIMGHSGNGVGERVYTHKTVQQLIDAVKLLD